MPGARCTRGLRHNGKFACNINRLRVLEKSVPPFNPPFDLGVGPRGLVERGVG